MLSCTSRGSPPDTFTWRKDNDPTVLQSTSITAVDYTSTSAVFRADYSINSITTSDSGTYTCNVTNPIGSDSGTITVVVNSKFNLLSAIAILLQISYFKRSTREHDIHNYLSTFLFINSHRQKKVAK